MIRISLTLLYPHDCRALSSETWDLSVPSAYNEKRNIGFRKVGIQNCRLWSIFITIPECTN